MGLLCLLSADCITVTGLLYLRSSSCVTATRLCDERFDAVHRLTRHNELMSCSKAVAYMMGVNLGRPRAWYLFSCQHVNTNDLNTGSVLSFV